MGASQAVIHQSMLFVQSALWGVCLAAAYDVLRILRRGIRHRRGLTAAEDIIYWLAAACVIFALLYRYDDGALRSYTIVGMTGGMVIYTLTVSRFAVAFFGKSLRKIVNSLNRLLKKCVKPFKISKNMKIKRKAGGRAWHKKRKQEDRGAASVKKEKEQEL